MTIRTVEDYDRKAAKLTEAKPANNGYGSVSFDSAQEGIKTMDWSSPQPLTNALAPVRAFDPLLIPAALRPWIVDVAERTQAPVEYVAVSAMVSAGATLGRKLALRPKRLDDWHEFANLWGAVIGPPSWMKSPALDEGKAPIDALEVRGLEGFELTHREWEADHEAAKVKRDSARDKAKQASKAGRAFDKMDLVAAAIPEEPKPPRIICNDATIPAMCEVLRANPNGIVVFRDELAGLIAELDREGMEGSRGFYLTGWSAKSGHTEDRIARGTNLRIPHVCLSLLGGIQPARVGPLLRESLSTGGGDGFLARFSLAVWPDNPGEYRAIDRIPDAAARKAAYAVYQRLHTLSPQSVGAECLDGLAPFLRLEDEAAEAFMEWDVQLRNRLRADTEDAALAAHLGKYPKAVCAIALLAHLADGGSGPVTLDALLLALAWAEFLESHAQRLYSSLGQAHVDSARSLLRRLQRGELPDPFTAREVYRRGWSHLQEVDTVRAAADLLDAKGYLCACSPQPGPVGGRSTVVYYINPAVRQ